MLRAVVVQGSQQIWVAALWYWGNSLDGIMEDYIPPWWIVLILWPLALMSFAFAYLMLYGLPGQIYQNPLLDRPNIPHRVLPTNPTQGAKFPENLVPSETCPLVSHENYTPFLLLTCALRFLASEILRDYWLSGVR